MSMSMQLINPTLAWPEIWMLCMACVVLLWVAFTGKRQLVTIHLLSQVALWTVIVGIWWTRDLHGQTFSGQYTKDALSDLLKIAIALINSMVLIYAQHYLRDRELLQGEFYVLALFSTLGMMVMVSASHFLSLYLGLELMSLCLYAMVAMQRDAFKATEAAMKYFILGALASGMLLYGMSIIYGATGSLGHAEIAAALSDPTIDSTVLRFGLVFLVIGIAFKLGAVPFHMWLPDVYQGAPTAVTLFIAAAPKLAAFAMLIRLLVDGLVGIVFAWQEMLMLLAVLSMIVGNVVAIAQTNLKRMLAYSTIAHVGFLLLGVLAGTAEGYSAALFYSLVYALMTLAAFGMILLMSRQGFEAEEIEDYRGLGQQQPWVAAMMLIVMFSMAGIPPLVGFYAKLVVIKAVIDVELLGVALIAVLMSVIGAYYYLRFIKVMFFDTAPEPLPIQAGALMRACLSVNALLILALGLFPSALLALCLQTFA